MIVENTRPQGVVVQCNDIVVSHRRAACTFPQTSCGTQHFYVFFSTDLTSWTYAGDASSDVFLLSSTFDHVGGFNDYVLLATDADLSKPDTRWYEVSQGDNELIECI